jgi:hypothetical protein
MKSLILGLALMSSTSAFATGSLFCELSVGTLSTLSLSLGSARMYGNPIISDVSLNGSGASYRHINTDIPKDQVVNYMSTGTQLYILALDNDFSNKTLEMSYDFIKNKGSAVLTLDGKTMKFTKIKCELE